MRRHVLAGLSFVLLLGAAPAFSQAVAESVLLNSNSAAATTKASSALGDALNGASKNVSGQIKTATKGSGTHPASANHSAKTVVVHPAAKTTGKAPAIANKPNAGGSSMITSIQGGWVTTAQKPANTPASPPATPQK